MSAKIKTGTRLTVTEREKLASEVEAHRTDQIETDNTYPMTDVPRNEDEHIRRVKKVLKEDASQDSYSEYEKRDMETERGKLREELPKMMVPQAEMMQSPANGGTQNARFRKAVNEHIRNELNNSRFKEMVERYKFLCYALGFPEEADIEGLRP